MAAKGTGTASKTAVWIIILLLIVGLGGFGVTNFSGNVRSIGTVGDTDIGVNRYARELQQQISAFSAQTGQPLSFADAQQIGIDQAVLQQLVSTVALEDEAADLGLSVGDAEIRDQVLSIPSFQGLDGNFDRLAYRDTLDRAGLNESQFEDSLRAEVARTMVQGAVSGGITAPEALVGTVFDYALERRGFSWASFGVENLAEPIGEPTEADLRAYYEENSDDFMLPETRRITYAWLTPDMIVDTIDGNDDALRALYQANIAEYVKPERRLVERLIYATRSAADAARARLDAGEATFEDLVAERDLDLSDLDLGDVTRDELGAAGEAVFALEEPGIAGPVATDLGPALFRVNAILSAQETPFEEARAELLGEYRLDAARRVIGDRIDPVDDLLAGGATLEELAAETEMQLGKIDWAAGETDGIAAYPAFRSAAASVAEGDFPEVLSMDDGGIFALRLDEVVEPRLQPFEDARGQAASGWRAATTVAALADQASALAEELRGGADPADLGLTLRQETGVTRGGFVPDAPPALLEAVFEMEPGEVRVVEGPTQAYIVRLDAAAPPDASDPDVAAQKSNYAESIAQSLGSDILRAYSQAVQAQAGISLNQAAINAVHANFQ